MKKRQYKGVTKIGLREVRLWRFSICLSGVSKEVNRNRNGVYILTDME